MPQVIIEGANPGSGNFAWDVVVDGARVDSLTSSHPRTTITRDHDFVAYVQYDNGSGISEFIVRSSNSPETVYLKHRTHLGFKQVSKEETEKERNRGCVSQFRVPLIIGGAILFFALLNQCSKLF